jgi:D-threonine aldolase
MRQHGYEIINVEEIASPALAVYPSIVQLNIIRAIKTAGKNILRPHIKTCKTPQVVQMMLNNGISHFKCATIAEAEMLGLQKAKDVLLAYQPVAENINRFKKIIAAYPETTFSCLVDNSSSLETIAAVFEGNKVNVFIDVNVGMNRTGLSAESAGELILACINCPSVFVIGIHAYDGNIYDTVVALRKHLADEAYCKAGQVRSIAEKIVNRPLELVIGGTPTFPMHAKRQNVQCSPGTFVFWDKGYSVFEDLPFKVAAILLTRVVSIVDDTLLCLDIGHKAVASENPLHQRLQFLNVDIVGLITHSEEHLVVRVEDTARHYIGEVWYAVPYHICPTVALYNELEVVEDGYRTQQWKVIARNRKINY